MEPTDRHSRMAPRTQEKVPLPSPLSILWDRVPGPKSHGRSQSRSHAETRSQPKPLWGGAASPHPGPWALHCGCLGCRGDSSVPSWQPGDTYSLQLQRKAKVKPCSSSGPELGQFWTRQPQGLHGQGSLSPRERPLVPRRFYHPPQSHVYPPTNAPGKAAHGLHLSYIKAMRLEGVWWASPSSHTGREVRGHQPARVRSPSPRCPGPTSVSMRPPPWPLTLAEAVEGTFPRKDMRFGQFCLLI